MLVLFRCLPPPARTVEIVDQADQDGVGWRAAVSVQVGLRVGASLRNGSLDRRHKVGQEPPEFAVAWSDRQLRHAAPRRLLSRQRLREKPGLAEPSRRRDEDQPGPGLRVRRCQSSA